MGDEFSVSGLDHDNSLILTDTNGIYSRSSGTINSESCIESRNYLILSYHRHYFALGEHYNSTRILKRL